MKHITIRKWRAEDYAAIVGLFQQVHEIHRLNRPDYYASVDCPLSQAEFTSAMKDDDVIALAAEADGDVVGFTIVKLREPSKNPRLLPRKVAFMEDLAVDSRFRRKGIGRLLFEAARNEASGRGYTKMELMVWSFNTSAMDFYKKAGMSERSVIMEMDIM